MEVGMTLFVSRASGLALIAAFASAFQPNHASAQVTDRPAPSSLLTAKATVPAGGVVHVTDVHGTTVTGVLGSVTSEAIQLTVEGETQTVFARDVQRMRWRQHDSWVTGAVIGAGIGAIPGIYYLRSDPNECAGLCPEEYALIGIGALVGALVDKAIAKNVTVYERPAAGGAGATVALTPGLTRARRGVHVTVRL
jgi:hypothetical protein